MAQFGIEMTSSYDKKSNEATITLKLKNASMIGLDNENAAQNLSLWLIGKIMNPEDYEDERYEDEMPNANLN